MLEFKREHSPTKEIIIAERERAKKLAQRYDRLLIACYILALGCMASIIVCLANANYFSWVIEIIFISFGIGIMLLVIAIPVSNYSKEHKRHFENLRFLDQPSDLEQQERILELSRNMPTCDDYRLRVAAQGRPFTPKDYDVILDLYFEGTLAALNAPLPLGNS